MIKMLKFIATVGTNASFSFNRFLLNYMRGRYSKQTEIEIQEIKNIPSFNEDMVRLPPQCVLELIDKIEAADGVIFATLEYDHVILAVLKSVLEWPLSVAHLLLRKSVMIVGGSDGVQGTVCEQIDLFQILNAPGVMTNTLPINEFMLGKVKNKLNQNEGLIHEQTIEFLDQCFANYVNVVNKRKLCFKKLMTKEEV
ncbi:NAD(P)H-dependent oxidoreductase [Liquorilactobacillus uvarum]|uniref:Flavin oxidoreductase n=1 Tax=Liquorilactobacillus uvarum DSM 19971 TaxID=1423812 RepID=A0A0R1PY41_9LACO|nr:NADPH-dependent FMN reductase [Liquorilactobacillus uvarum]KRL37465.1 flavin oxidoreductase [Liquorilactobacillus uvarum DSM 19971]